MEGLRYLFAKHKANALRFAQLLAIREVELTETRSSSRLLRPLKTFLL